MRGYLIRVQLPDRPGALGAVASRIGSVGGDVISIDILERDDGLVVDELGVRLPGDHLVKLVRDEILEVDGVLIESIRPTEDPVPDRFADLSDVVADLFVRSGRGEPWASLAHHARRSLGATYAAVVDPRGHALAADGEPPDVEELRALGVGGTTDEADRKPAVARAELRRAGLVLLVGREDPVLRVRERQWVSLMAELADHRGGMSSSDDEGHSRPSAIASAADPAAGSSQGSRPGRVRDLGQRDVGGGREGDLFAPPTGQVVE